MKKQHLNDSVVMISPDLGTADASRAGGRRLLDLVNELEVPLSLEKSLKFGRQHVFDQRFLIGINTTDLAFERVSQLCRALQIDVHLLDCLARDYQRSDMVLFGFEGGEHRITYKVYLQFRSELMSELARGEAIAPRPLFLAYKWEIGETPRATDSRYICYPSPNPLEIMRRVDVIYGENTVSCCRDITKMLLESGEKRAANPSFVYLEVEEAGNTRQSFDINLYPAQFRMHELQAQIIDICRHFNVPEMEVQRLLKPANDSVLGHISGGQNRHGKEFFTLYYEMD